MLLNLDYEKILYTKISVCFVGLAALFVCRSVDGTGVAGGSGK